MNHPSEYTQEHTDKAEKARKYKIKQNNELRATLLTTTGLAIKFLSNDLFCEQNIGFPANEIQRQESGAIHPLTLF